MAEETPDSLRGFFGGRAASNSGQHLDESERRLSSVADKMSAVFENIVRSASTGWANSGGPTAGNGGGTPNGGHSPSSHRADQESRWTGGGGYQGQRSNGGGVTFGGQAPGATGEPSGGAHRAETGGAVGRATGAAGNMYAAAGGRVGVAKKVAIGAAGATAVYTINHAADQMINQSIAAQATYGQWGGSNPNGAYAKMFTNNYTAANAADMQTYQRNLSMSGGGIPGSAMYAQNRRMIESTSLVDPTITNTASMAASTSLGSTGSFNRMAALGINPMGPGGSMQGDPMSVARQILTRMGSTRVKTEAQVDAAFSPSGSATVTIDNYVADGYLDPSAVPAVKANMRGILKAQVKGMGYSDYRSKVQAASQSGGVPDDLKNLGIGNSVIAGQRQNEGMNRNSEAQTIEGFVATLTLSTSAKKKMNSLVNEILGIPGVGEVAGGASGFTAGGFSSIMKSAGKLIPSIGILGGDGPASASHYGTNYSAAAGAAAAKGGFGTGSHARSASGGGGGGAPASTGTASASKYSLGAVKPWVASAANIIGPKFGITTVYGVGSRPEVSDHPAGLALDFMCSTATGNKLAPFVQANAKKLNVTYIIWQQRIWNISRAGEGWRQMEDRGSPTANHMDHVHVSFLASPVNTDYSGMNSGGGAATMSAGGSTGSAGGTDTASMTSGPPGASTYSGIGYTQLGALGSVGAGGGGGGMMSGSMGTGSGTGTMATTGSSGVGSTGAGGMVRNGTYNVLFSSSNKGTEGDLKKIMGDADVLGLTEFTGKKAALAKWLGKNGWGTYHGKGDAAITWNKDKYTGSKFGDWLMNKGDWPRPGSSASQYAAYGLMTDKETGAQFWEIAAHMISKAGAGRIHESDRVPIKQKEIAALSALTKKLGANGLPVFLTGDLNMDLDRGDWANIGGLSSNWKPGQTGPGTDRPNNYIDHILSNPALATLLGTSVVTGLSSDHNAALAQYNLAGQGQSPTSGQTTNQSAQTPDAARAYARSRIAGMGWSQQFDSLNNLWNRESGWRWNADNPSSSAYGIPQALPGSKMASAGGDWKTNGVTQVNWGLDYIKGRYGDPNHAWAHSQSVGWYADGAWSISKDHLAGIHKGEMILPEKVAAAVRNELTAPTRGGGSGPGIVFQDGSIKIYLQTGGAKEAQKAGTMFVDAVAKDRRIQNMLSGVNG